MFINNQLLRRIELSVSFCIVLLLSSCTSPAPQRPSIPAPKTAKQIQTFSLYNLARTDLFHWLSNKKEPKVLFQLNDENIYMKQVLSFDAVCADSIESEMARWKPHQNLVPHPFYYQSYLYYSRLQKNALLPTFLRDSKHTQGEIILDLNQAPITNMGPFAISTFQPSPNGNYLLYGIEQNTTGETILLIQDIKEKSSIVSPIRNTAGQACWNSDSQSFYYLTYDQRSRISELRQHRLGQSENQDPVIYEQKDEQQSLRLRMSASGQYVFIESHDQSSNETSFFACQYAEGFSPQIFTNRMKGVFYYLDHQDNQFFVLSNYENANYGVYSCSEPGNANKSWQRVQAPQDKIVILAASYPPEHVILEEAIGTLRRLKSINCINGEVTVFANLTLEKSVYVDKNIPPSFLPTFSLQSPIYTSQTFVYKLLDQSKETIAESLPTTSFKPETYQSLQVSAAGRDGIALPLTLFYKRGIIQDGQHAALLTLKVADEESDPLQFNPFWIPFLERGVILAVAHIRGDGLLPVEEQADGLLMTRQKGIFDFIACGEHLVNQRWAHPDRLAVVASEEGAWVVAASLNIHPGLFCCALLDNPHTDPLAMLIDETNPLISIRTQRWGNLLDKTQYDLLYGMSPYDQIEAKDYPDILVIADYEHLRAPYWQAAKWVAKIRMFNTAPTTQLLYTRIPGDKNALSWSRLNAFKTTFLLKQMGFFP